MDKAPPRAYWGNSMANVFDQFDSLTAAKANVFDQFNNMNAAPSTLDDLGAGFSGALQGAKTIGMGFVNEAAKGATSLLLRPVDAAVNAGLNAFGMTGTTNAERGAKVDQFFQQNSNPSAPAFKIGQAAADIAGTAGVGGVLGNTVRAAGEAAPVVAPYVPKIASALESGGFNLGSPAATTTAGKVADLATRIGAGATVGGVSAGMVDPSSAGTGAALGGALPLAAKVAGIAGKMMAGNTSATEQAQNAVRDAVLKAGQDAGYVVPPSTVNPGIVNQTLESIGGKAAVGQAASIQNQKITNSLARKALGLPDAVPLSEQTLDAYRTMASQPYREVAALPALPPTRTTAANGYPIIGPAQQTPADALHDLQQARFDANDYWNQYRRTGEVSARDAATSAGNKADQLENYLEQTAIAAGKPDLVDALRQARTAIAKSYTVQGALNTSTGDVSARDLSKMLYRNKPLDPALETAARFADAFPKANQDVAAIGSQGVSKIAAGLASVLASGGYASGGPIASGAAAAIPFIAPALAKKAVLSNLYQGAMAVPPYASNPAIAGRLSNLAGNPLLRAPLYGQQPNRSNP